MGALYQVLEIIFEVQRKMNNEKITKKETSFATYKHVSFFWTPPTFKPCNILIHFKQFKVL